MPRTKLEVEAYLAKHNLAPILRVALNQAVQADATDPLTFIATKLKEQSKKQLEWERKMRKKRKKKKGK